MAATHTNFSGIADIIFDNLAFITSYVVLWLLVVILALLMVVTLRHLGVFFDAMGPLIHLTREEALLKINDPLPPVTFRDADSTTVILEELASTRTLLLMVSPSCSACDNALSVFREGQSSRWFEGWTAIVVLSSSPDEVRSFRASYSIDSSVVVLADEDSRSFRAWGVPRTPSLLVVDQSLHIQRKIANVTARQIDELLITHPESIGIPATEDLDRTPNLGVEGDDTSYATTRHK